MCKCMMWTLMLIEWCMETGMVLIPAILSHDLRLWDASINHPNIPDDTQSAPPSLPPSLHWLDQDRILARSDQRRAGKSLIVTALIDIDINTGL